MIINICSVAPHTYNCAGSNKNCGREITIRCAAVKAIYYFKIMPPGMVRNAKYCRSFWRSSSRCTAYVLFRDPTQCLKERNLKINIGLNNYFVKTRKFTNTWLSLKPLKQGVISIYRGHLTSMGISIIKTRQSHDHLVSVRHHYSPILSLLCNSYRRWWNSKFDFLVSQRQLNQLPEKAHSLWNHKLPGSPLLAWFNFNTNRHK